MKTYIKFIIIFWILFSFKIFAQVPSVINVEIDWMEDGTHSHKPKQAEIDAVKQMFACHGITLNVELSNSVTHVNTLRRDSNPDRSKRVSFFDYKNGGDTFGTIKALNFNHSGGGWHYCLFAHQYQDTSFNPSGSSGLGESPGDDFIVTLGSFDGAVGTPWDRASTFAHELGHNLGLQHSGNMDENVVGQNTPNFPSIMSYFYQLAGVRNNLECQGLIPEGLSLYKNLDYSNGRACPVDENALNEAFGIGITPVDWNCDGNVGGIVSHDISNQSSSSGWCNAKGTKSFLNDYDEWSHIHDYTGVLPKNYVSKEISCITYEEYIAKVKNKICAQPPVVNEACVNNQMYYVSGSNEGSVDGSCSQPIANFGIAYTIAEDGDIIYLFPGNHHVGEITISKKLIITSPGTAVLGR